MQGPSRYRKGRQRGVAGPTQGGATRPGAETAMNNHTYLRDSTLRARLGNPASDFLDRFKDFSRQGIDGLAQLRSGRMPKRFKPFG